MPASAGFLEIKGGIGWYRVVSYALQIRPRKHRNLCSGGSIHFVYWQLAVYMLQKMVQSLLEIKVDKRDYRSQFLDQSLSATMTENDQGQKWTKIQQVPTYSNGSMDRWMTVDHSR